VSVPVVCVDGPSGAGKGTLSLMLARSLGWHLLDSGALYRVLAEACSREHVSWDDVQGVTAVASALDVDFLATDDGVTVRLSGLDITRDIRSEAGGVGASAVALIAEARQALLVRQRELAVAPGLVADGRDMGTVVFPNAPLKIFLTASAEARANRRFLQLQARGEDVRLPRLLEGIQQRDERDSSREVSPLTAAEDAIVIDSTSLSADGVHAKVMKLVHERGLHARNFG